MYRIVNVEETMKSEIEKWRNDMGFNFLVRPEQDTLKSALELSTNINNLNVEEIDKVLLVLSAYHSFLSSQLGMLDARVSYLEDELNSKLNLKASKYTAPSAAERRAIAISRDKDAAQLDKKLIKEKSKKNMLRPIVDSIRVKIDAIKKIYDRGGRHVA